VANFRASASLLPFASNLITSQGRQMKLITFIQNGRHRIGEVVDDTVYVTAWTDPMTSLIRRGITPSRTYERFALSSLTLDAPLVPSKIIAIGRNYSEHAKEVGGTLPTEPLIFAKLPSSIIGPNRPITWRTSITQQVDWEGELAVVIGKRARNVSEEDAMNYVFGYTIANDITARDLQRVKDSQWTRAKGLDTYCPLGPCIVTRDEIADPHELALKTVVNGETRQDGNTRDMIFRIPSLIAYVSRMFTLEAGDLILTGTPSGVGQGMNPPTFLNDGDTVTITIEGIGELSNPCVIEAEE
jgi:2-keto-4-pentenoate hydratase/2-oxohepta-3-ene-1,7-dioic acid hydratase in catechol pathway